MLARHVAAVSVTYQFVALHHCGHSTFEGIVLLYLHPPPRSFAADAHDCIMVAVLRDRPNTSVWRSPRVTLPERQPAWKQQSF